MGGAAIALLLLLGAAVIALSKKRTPHPTIQDMVNGVDVVKLELMDRLVGDYSDSKERKDTIRWAGAVTNYVFSSQPTGNEHVRFSDENMASIIELARQIPQRYPDARPAITQAVRVKVVIDNAGGNVAAENITDPLERLQHLGILVEGGPDANDVEYFTQVIEAFRKHH